MLLDSVLVNTDDTFSASLHTWRCSVVAIGLCEPFRHPYGQRQLKLFILTQPL